MPFNRIIAIILFFSFFISGCRQQAKKEYWRDGKLKSEIGMKGTIYDGKATWWYENGKKQMVCFYINNQLDSILTRWFTNGNKQEEVHYRDNKPDGVNMVWNNDGNKIIQRYYSKGILNGTFTEWHPNGQLKTEGRYKTGNIDGKWLYCDTFGVIIGYGTFNNGNGVQKAFHENGILKRETNYINNLKEGVEKDYDISGKLKSSRTYKAGVLM